MTVKAAWQKINEAIQEANQLNILIGKVLENNNEREAVEIILGESTKRVCRVMQKLQSAFNDFIDYLREKVKNQFLKP